MSNNEPIKLRIPRQDLAEFTLNDCAVAKGTAVIKASTFKEFYLLPCVVMWWWRCVVAMCNADVWWRWAISICGGNVWWRCVVATCGGDARLRCVVAMSDVDVWGMRGGDVWDA